MSTTNLQTTLGLDVSQYVAGAQKQIEAMGGQAAGIEGLISVSDKFNTSQKQVAATINQTVSQMQTAVTKLRALKKEEEEILALGGQVAGKVPGKDLVLDSVTVKTDFRKLLDPDKVAAGFAAREQLSQLFPAPTNATIGQMAKYETALGRVQKLMETGKVSKERFNEILNTVKAGDSLSKLKLTGDEAKLAGAIGNIKDNFSEAQKASDSFLLSKKNAFRIAEALLLKEAIGGLIGQLQKAALEAVAFQIKISEIRTLSTENQSSFNAWSKSIERVSDAFGIPQVEVAKAAYEALSAQVTRSKDGTEQFLNAAANLARVGVSDIGEAGKLLASVFNAYNVSADRAEEVSAKLFVAIDRGNFTAKDLAGNFGRVETTAATLGVSFDELLAAMTTLTRQGVNASDAQTQLSNVFLKLLNPSQAAQKILRSWGFETGQAAIAGLGFVGVLQKIQAATQGDAHALAEFGGEMRSIRGLIGLTTRGKGEEFQQDLAEIKNDAKKRFNEAKGIRGESAGDQLTIEANKIKNFFTNDLGQSALNSLNNLVKDFGHLNDVVRIGTTGLVDIVKVYGLYIITSRLASFETKVFNGALNIFATQTGLQSTKVMSVLTFSTNVFNAAIKAAGIALVAAFAIDEIAKWRREMDGVNKKSEDYENTLKRILSLREGKTDTGESIGQKVFQENALKQADKFGNFVDNLFQTLAREQADNAIAATRDLDFLKEKGKEAALQLSESFKRTGDSVHGLIKQHEEAFSKARAEVDKSKKAVLGYKETVQSLKFDLDFEFANDANNFQKFQLRDQEIVRLRDKAKELLQSNNNEDIDKGRQIAQEVLRKVKEDASERVKLQVEQDKARIQAQGGPRPGESPFVFANTAEQKNRLDDFANFFQKLEDDIQRRKKDEEDQNTKLINQEKDRLRKLEDRVKLFNQLKLFNDEGKLNPDFAGEGGKLDQNKFNKEFEARSKAIVELLKTEEEKNILLPQLEQSRLNLLKQQTAEIRLQDILTKQLQAGNIQKTAKDEFERATKSKIEASATAERAGKELGSASEIIQGFLDRTRTDDKFSTIGEGENFGVRNSQKFLKLINDLIDSGIKATGRTPLPFSERQAVQQQNEGLIKSIVDTQKEIDENRNKLLERDKDGNLSNNPQAIANLRSLNDSLISKLNLLLSKFTGSSNNTDIAVPGGATLGELRTQLNQALDLFIKSRLQANDADKVQKSLEESLSKIFTPAQIAAAKQETATNTLTGATLRAATATENLVLQFKNLPQLAPPVTPSNVPLTMPSGNGFHDGGLIKGPKGYDNLLVRAEANEFIVNQEATKKWLPELIAMNNGRSPKFKGKYHEGGLVQTNVGDVNVTITGPVSPERNVRQIGKQLRRHIRMGLLEPLTGN